MDNSIIEKWEKNKGKIVPFFLSKNAEYIAKLEHRNLINIFVEIILEKELNCEFVEGEFGKIKFTFSDKATGDKVAESFIYYGSCYCNDTLYAVQEFVKEKGEIKKRAARTLYSIILNIVQNMKTN